MGQAIAHQEEVGAVTRSTVYFPFISDVGICFSQVIAVYITGNQVTHYIVIWFILNVKGNAFKCELPRIEKVLCSKKL